MSRAVVDWRHAKALSACVRDRAQRCEFFSHDYGGNASVRVTCVERAATIVAMLWGILSVVQVEGGACAMALVEWWPWRERVEDVLQIRYWPCELDGPLDAP